MSSEDKKKNENIAKVKELFPHCVREVLKDGEKKLLIDFELLRKALPDGVYEDERYSFTWVGKREAIRSVSQAPKGKLVPYPEESVNFEKTKNLYIEGDNLEVMKNLRESYSGKIKMIYIDPPYNTGQNFIYSDNFVQKSSSELVNSEECSHTAWLNMIYPRLMIARELMTDDGIIFVSIDDRESANLKKVLDEIFDSSNFIATFKWNRTAKAPSLSAAVRIKYEYIHCYKKGGKPALYGKPSYNTEAPLWHLPNKQTRLVFPKGSIRIPHSFPAKQYSEKYQVVLENDMQEKGGYNANEVSISACAAWSQNKILEYLASGKTFLVKKNLSTVYYDMDPNKTYLPPADIISNEECGVKRNTEAKAEMRQLGIEFDYSKPVSLIYYLINMLSKMSKDFIVLDFFSGSATTAHAVMKFNAENNAQCKYIMVQIPEEIKDGKQSGLTTLTELGKERIRRAGAKIQETHITSKLDLGFKVLKLQDK